MTALVGPAETATPLPRRTLIILIVAALGLYAVAWGTWVLLPVRWFVTYVHELGHALMAEVAGSIEQAACQAGLLMMKAMIDAVGPYTQWFDRDRRCLPARRPGC